MDDTFKDFNKRHRAVTRKHRRLAQGYVTKLNRNGVIEHKPLNQSKAFTMKGFAFLILGLLIFKGYLLAGLGAEDYQTHVAALSNGNMFEQLGAWLMQVEPVSRLIADLFVSIGV